MGLPPPPNLHFNNLLEWLIKSGLHYKTVLGFGNIFQGRGMDESIQGGSYLHSVACFLHVVGSLCTYFCGARAAPTKYPPGALCTAYVVNCFQSQPEQLAL